MLFKTIGIAGLWLAFNGVALRQVFLFYAVGELFGAFAFNYQKLRGL